MRKATKGKITDPTTLLRDRCLSHFTTLRVPVQSAALDELLTRAEKENLSYLSFLDRLLGAEAGARRELAVARRIRDARFRENKTLEGFDWNFNPKTFNRVQMEELATGDFIRRHTNLVMVGWSGIGKSHMIQAIGQRACVNGYRVLYKTSTQLLEDRTASLADKTLPVRLRRYAKPARKNYQRQLQAGRPSRRPLRRFRHYLRWRGEAWASLDWLRLGTLRSPYNSKALA